MMIRRQAIRDFLDRPLRDSGIAKSFSEQAIDRKIARIYPPPRFHTKPRLHQKICFLLGCKYSHYLHLLDMGLGKSKVLIDLFQHALDIHPDDQPRLRMLVVVPAWANLEQWVMEVRKHAPDLRCVKVDGTGEAERKGQVFDPAADLVIITYMGLLALCCGKEGPQPSGGRKPRGGRKWQPQEGRLREFLQWFKFFGWDEADAFKNHTSLTYRVVRRLSRDKNTLYSYALTGTPFGKSPEDLWGLFHAIDGGAALGETLGLYRAAFFTEHPNFWGGSEYKFQHKMKKALNRMMRNSSIRYDEGECNDLPDKVYIRRPVQMPVENHKYYSRLMGELEAARESYQLLESAFIQLRQLCSGYLTFRKKDRQGAEVDRQTLVFKNNPKVDDLLQFLQEVPPHKKVVVFLEYKKSGEIVCEALKKAKVNHVRLYSGTRKSDRPVERFQSEPAVRVLVSSSAGARGINLHEVAHYCYFFEAPVNPILRQQEEKRVHRMGQQHTCFIVDCYVKGSIEQTILHALRNNKDLFQQIVDGRKVEESCTTHIGTKASPIVQPGRSGSRGRSAPKPSATGRSRLLKPLLPP